MKKLSDYISLEDEIETISASELRAHLGECITQAVGGKTFIVKRKGDTPLFLSISSPNVGAYVESLGFKAGKEGEGEIKPEPPTEEELQATMDGHTFMSLFNERNALSEELKIVKAELGRYKTKGTALRKETGG